MKIKVIQIGNSKGIRLPQAILHQYQLKDEVMIELKKEGILISPLNKPRADWEEQFKHQSVEYTQKEKEWIHIENKFDKEDEWTW